MKGEISLHASEIGNALYRLIVEARKESVENPRKGKPKVILIAGPTACGKSEFAMMLAKAMGGEIVSGDSMQVYRGLDIGTAKPTMEERLQIPHHLLDICEITHPFTVIDFYHAAVKAIQDILERKNVPIIVGGSGFYLHALLYGPPAGPPPAPEVRRLLEAELAQEGPEALYSRLLRLDPEYAQGITSHDRHKIVRALEIITVTGDKVSSLPWRGREAPNKFDLRCWFLTRPKDVLYRRIEKRCHRMVEMGFLDEVERMEKAGLRQNAGACQAIGYRQGLEYLQTTRSQADLEQFMANFAQATRHYAKRQFTWFRREPLYRWLDIDVLDFENAMELLFKDYERLS